MKYRIRNIDYGDDWYISKYAIENGKVVFWSDSNSMVPHLIFPLKYANYLLKMPRKYTASYCKYKIEPIV